MGSGPGWTPFRRQLLSLIPADVEHLAAHPTTAFVWPTETCSIGCAHCNFSSLPRRGAAGSSQMVPAVLVEWLLDAGVRTATLCGGGEPLDEPEFCEEFFRLTAPTPLNVGIYTSGASLLHPHTPHEYVMRWLRLRGEDPPGSFWVRLSFDRFHSERLGTAVLASWIETVEALAPRWRVSLRGLRVVGDPTLRDVAGRLRARVEERGAAARLVLPSGRRIPVERMAFVLDGRGSLEVLTRHGLSLPDSDADVLAPLQDLVGRTHHLGRPLSRRLTVGQSHVDIEIHANGDVHVLESQAFDARLSLEGCDWDTMRECYYRDPVVHAVAIGGLPLAADFLQQAIREGVAPSDTTPFSVESLHDPDVLDWVTAAAAVRLADVFRYPEPALAMARARLDRS